jgi:glycosyltransferase involved in cell wall biosynthesis
MLDAMQLVDCEFHIVGDGEYGHKIASLAFRNVSIISHGYVENDELRRLVIENGIGLAAGMGTSMLETAAMGLPSLIINPSYTEIPDSYQPKWLYEMQDFSLGEFECTSYGKVFADLYEEYLKDTDGLIAMKCNEHVKRNHTMSEVIYSLERHF